MAQSTHWCFTINNYTNAEQDRLRGLGADLAGAGLRYLCYGREVGDGGTPHLQGYVVFSLRVRLRRLRDLISRRGHYEVSRARGTEGADYCKKDGDFDEFGVLPTRGRPRSDRITDFCDWVRVLEQYPSQHDIISNHPDLWLRFGTKLWDIVNNLRPVNDLADGALRAWQDELYNRLMGEPDDRTVEFIVDEEGGFGKSWFCRYMLSKNKNVQVLTSGKIDDICFMIDPTKNIYLFSIPRNGMEFLQYRVLEMLKDRMVFSNKYYSQMKIITRKCHVVVLCNEHPNETKMSLDRYKITIL